MPAMLPTPSPRRASGYSLPEAVLAAAVTVTVLLAMYLILDTTQQTHSRGLAKAAVQQDVTTALEQLAHELRSAGYTPAKTGCTSPPQAGISALSSAPVSVTFLTDSDGDDCTNRLIYTFVPPTNPGKPCDASDTSTIGTLTRSTQAWTGAAWNPATPPATTVARCITALTLTAYDLTGAVTTTPSNVKRLRIAMTGVENSRMTTPQAYSLSIDVAPRNLL